MVSILPILQRNLNLKRLLVQNKADSKPRQEAGEAQIRTQTALPQSSHPLAPKWPKDEEQSEEIYFLREH